MIECLKDVYIERDRTESAIPVKTIVFKALSNAAMISLVIINSSLSISLCFFYDKELLFDSLNKAIFNAAEFWFRTEFYLQSKLRLMTIVLR